MANDHRRDLHRQSAHRVGVGRWSADNAVA